MRRSSRYLALLLPLGLAAPFACGKVETAGPASPPTLDGHGGASGSSASGAGGLGGDAAGEAASQAGSGGAGPGAPGGAPGVGASAGQGAGASGTSAASGGSSSGSGGNGGGAFGGGVGGRPEPAGGAANGGTAGGGGSVGQGGGGASGGGSAGEWNAGLPGINQQCDLASAIAGGPGPVIDRSAHAFGSLPCLWVTRNTTVSFLHWTADTPLFGMQSGGSQPNPIAAGAPHTTGSVGVLFPEPGAFGYYDGKHAVDDASANQDFAGGIFVTDVFGDASSGGAETPQPAVAGCQEQGPMDVQGAGPLVITVDAEHHVFTPACLHIYGNDWVSFQGLSPAHPLYAMAKHGNVPNILSDGEPHTADFAVHLPPLDRMVFGFYDGAFGSDSDAGSAGMAGAIYVYPLPGIP